MADFWLAAYFVFDCSGLDNKAKCLAFLRGWPFALFSQEFLNHTNYSKLFCLLLGLLVVVWPSLFFYQLFKSLLSLQGMLFSLWYLQDTVAALFF